ncbi:MAG: TetR/AcrR family transcriptional regulator, partial [Mycobacteriaceae bacterium]|nr:TetR/AcrR family transcriptional regulator [Mycobacteriaceae bacterium]
APAPPDDPMGVLSAAVTALLGPERANQKQIRACATDIIGFLRDGQAAALELMDPPKARD